MCVCVHRYTRETPRDGRLQLYVTDYLIIFPFIKGGSSEELHRFQKVNLQHLVDVEETIQYQDKALKLKRLKKRKKKNGSQRLNAYCLLSDSPSCTP